MGAGPAGLAAGLKLAENEYEVVIIDKDNQVGGISKTVKYNNFLFDIGPHRFFTKIPEVDKLWNKTLGEDFIKVKRKTRIFYRNKFFDYPVKLKDVLKNLGFIESLACMISFIYAKLSPYKKEDTFDKWIVNRFGKRLFKHFFKSYTEKLWGIPCNKIQAEWAAQRIKNLSLWGAIKNALPVKKKKNKIKSLIEEFNYPKFGAGMMYEKMAENIIKCGGRIILNTRVEKINRKANKIISVETKNDEENQTIMGDYFISTIPLTELVKITNPGLSQESIEQTKKLTYRNFISASIVYYQRKRPEDNWLYIHSPDVSIVRAQIRNNWGPYVLTKKQFTSLGIEYFCDENSNFWNKKDREIIKLADKEIKKIGIIRKNSKIKTTIVLRYPKAYPKYLPGYKKRLKIIKKDIIKFKNLQTIGRYGMFRYNNMDHSIYTGILAAKNIIYPKKKYDIWKVNQDQQYHEEKRKTE